MTGGPEGIEVVQGGSGNRNWLAGLWLAERIAAAAEGRS